MNNETDKKLDQLSRDIKEGHAALHQRHDRADAEMDYLHDKMDKFKTFLSTVWKAVVDVFKRDNE